MVYLTKLASFFSSFPSITKIVYAISTFLFAVSVAHSMNWGLLQLLVTYLASCILLLVIIYSLNSVDLVKKNNREFLVTHKYIIGLICFIFLSAVSVLYLLCLYPGICSLDSNDIIRMSLGIPFEADHFRYSTINNHHPYLYVVSIKMILNAVLALGGDITTGVAAVSLAHALFLAACYSICIIKIIDLTGNWMLILFSVVFYIIYPITPFYSITVWKDIPFTGIVLVIAAQLATLPVSRDYKKDLFPILICTLICSLVRNNGLIVSIVVFLLIIMHIRRKYVFKYLGTLCLVYFLITGPIFSLLGVKPAHFSESIGLPLQQISRTLSDGGRIDESQSQFLDSILPLPSWTSTKDTTSPNAIKFNHDFNDYFLENNKIEFLLTWIKIGIANPISYLRAWVDLTDGFWSFDRSFYYLIQPGYSLDNNINISDNLLSGYFEISDLYNNAQSMIASCPVLFQIGTYVWFTIFTLIFGLTCRRPSAILVACPYIALLFTYLLAAPACDYRYGFPYVLAVPLLVSTMFSRTSGFSTHFRSFGTFNGEHADEAFVSPESGEGGLCVRIDMVSEGFLTIPKDIVVSSAGVRQANA